MDLIFVYPFAEKKNFSKLLGFVTFQPNRQASSNTIQICREGQFYLNGTAVYLNTFSMNSITSMNKIALL